MVERQLVSEGTSRAALGREAFLERTWAWKKQYHGNIRRQLDLMGASCDWTRERFTLDEGLSKAVREAFVRLHAEGLITRGEYIVNWSPALGTAVSDLEVEMKPVRGKLYHIAYDVDGSAERIVVATTRPETMLVTRLWRSSGRRAIPIWSARSSCCRSSAGAFPCRGCEGGEGLRHRPVK